jgi:hypothetical protein
MELEVDATCIPKIYAQIHTALDVIISQSETSRIPGVTFTAKFLFLLKPLSSNHAVGPNTRC